MNSRPGLGEAFAALNRLRGSPRHHFSPPASDAQLEKARAEFGEAFTDDLVKLYKWANGFRLNVMAESGEAGIELFSIDRLHTPRARVQDWDYGLHGDPDRLLIFYVVDGCYLSLSRFGTPSGVWIDDDREGAKKLHAQSLAAVLHEIVAQVERGEDGFIHCRRAGELAGGYAAESKRLDEAMKKSERAAWKSLLASDPAAQAADDWSDV